MAHEVTIRPAKLDDLPGVRALLVETWHDTYDHLIGAQRVTEITDSWHSLENLERQLGQPDSSFLVAVENGVTVGHIFAHAQRAPVLTISRLYVAPARQRMGIGKHLLDAAIARHADCKTVRLMVEAENEKGIAFYDREGFQSVGETVVGGIRHFRLERNL